MLANCICRSLIFNLRMAAITSNKTGTKRLADDAKDVVSAKMPKKDSDDACPMLTKSVVSADSTVEHEEPPLLLSTSFESEESCPDLTQSPVEAPQADKNNGAVVMPVLHRQLSPNVDTPVDVEADLIIKQLNEMESDITTLRDTFKVTEMDKGSLRVKLSDGFLERSLAKSLFDYLESHVCYYPPEQTKVRVFGKWHNIPRKQMAFGDEGISYAFSGTSIPAQAWSPVLGALRSLVNTVGNQQFNFALVNRYANGQDYIGPHRDNETGLDKKAAIASLSLGAPRDFVFKKVKGRDTKEFVLRSGSLLFMLPPTNDLYTHSLPKVKNLMQPRINITFRKMIV